LMKRTGGEVLIRGKGRPRGALPFAPERG
jgi:hypothetical protein